MTMVNDLYFDDVVLDEELRAKLDELFADDSVYNIFGKEINFLALDSRLDTKTKLPAVELVIASQTPYDIAQEDIQIQPYTQFTVELNVYTSGKDKRLNNMKLCNAIIRYLQVPQSLGAYFNRGLKLESNDEVTAMIASTCRRVIRLRGLCDNSRKYIYSK